MNRHPAHIPKWGIDLRPIIAYGFSVLGMSDVEMARELCITKARVGQIRNKAGATLPKCTACGKISLRYSGRKEISVCKRCQFDIPSRFCVICKERKVVKPDDDRCWKCRKTDFNHTDEGRNFHKLRMRKYIEKISNDPMRKEKRRAQIKEWNRRAREKRLAKESIS